MTTTSPGQAVATEGIAAARAGDRDSARRLLRQAIQLDPRDLQAWLWLAGTLDEPGERRYCFERVLALDPHHAAARQELDKLQPSFSAPQVSSAYVGVLPATAPRTHIGPWNEADVELVIGALSSGRSADDVCRMLCEEHGYTWPNATALVDEVRQTRKITIARRQSPFMMLMAIATVLGGIALVAYSMLKLYQLGSYAAYASLSRYGRRRIHNAVALGILGLWMIVGGLIGIGQTIWSLWD